MRRFSRNSMTARILVLEGLCRCFDQDLLMGTLKNHHRLIQIFAIASCQVSVRCHDTHFAAYEASLVIGHPHAVAVKGKEVAGHGPHRSSDLLDRGYSECELKSNNEHAHTLPCVFFAASEISRNLKRLAAMQRIAGSPLVPKVPSASENHRQVVLVAGLLELNSELLFTISTEILVASW